MSDATPNAVTTPAPAPLQVNANLLPERQHLFAAEKITDVLPNEAYARIGQLQLSAEEEASLDAPVADDEIDLRPDGLIYVSHEYIRRRFNEAFGRMGWTLVPGSPLIRRPDSNEYFQRWVLFIRGIYCAEALSSAIFRERKQGGDDDEGGDSGFMSIDDLSETIKSNCARRCAKDLGLGLEVWNRRFQERWRDQYGMQVLVRGRRGNRRLWRRKDAPPFTDRWTGEVMEFSIEPAPKKAAPPSAQGTDQPAGPSGPVTTPPAAAPPPAPPAAAAPEPPAQAKPAAPIATPPPAAETQSSPPAADAGRSKDVANPPTPRAGAAGGRKILPTQIRGLLARCANAKLLVGDDATAAIDWLCQVFALKLDDPTRPATTSLLQEMLGQLGAHQVTEVAQKLDQVAKGAAAQ